ncbi:von Willebrand factor type A [Desulfatibacillum aliphaticivorans]|uniref:von Willebrand factor type A n=1 Tax=Desulfatibacillum aliphaticivorans TaxID=218208 RepID=B8F8Z5_DESAL|nr:VWA domain-containing protein [Desulfatibacillum aliphaticivorans]ACL02027.1 von Willebrand factor type A [Desulfatibacillum aliphaticivorans]
MQSQKEQILRDVVTYALLIISIVCLAGSAAVSFTSCSPKTVNEDAMTGYSGYTSKSTSAEPSMSAAKPCPAPKSEQRYAYYCRVPDYNTEEYAPIREGGFKSPLYDPLSTFSIDVDTASYSNVRRFLSYGNMPPVDAVRIEEMINYFHYDYPQPKGQDPFSITMEMSQCPWNRDNMLVHVGLQGRCLDYKDVKPSNLVFLLDVSGSMNSENKLPLVKRSMEMLVKELGAGDRVSIVTYAGSAGLVLPSTSARNKRKIITALDRLEAGGSTAGGEGIELAYRVAWENLIPEGNNRVILCTDGDFNVGVSSTPELVRMIEEKRRAGIYLTICGFGMGNYKDEKMEAISNAGNGNFYYIDSRREAHKVFVQDMRANMFTLAKDVKIQVEFNPGRVSQYRLVGYENRLLAAEDFNNDLKDAGEIGPGHSVTALYEIVPAGLGMGAQRVDPLKYQESEPVPELRNSNEILTIKFRYKNPEENRSRLITRVLDESSMEFGDTSDDFRFSAAVAGWGMLLRNSSYADRLTWGQIQSMAEESVGPDEMGYRAEFIKLVKTCRELNS